MLLFGEWRGEGEGAETREAVAPEAEGRRRCAVPAGHPSARARHSVRRPSEPKGLMELRVQEEQRLQGLQRVVLYLSLHTRLIC